MRRLIPALLLVLALWPGQARAQGFSFVIMGDMPYGPPEETAAPLAELVGAINGRAPELVIHLGDIQSGGMPCTDAVQDAQLAVMNAIRAPVLYTPGDNEWTDCHRHDGADPLERLARLRRTFFAFPAFSLGGQPVPVTHQGDAGYPENARLVMDGIVFATAHVVGSNNGFEPRDPAAVAEFLSRDAAATAWLRAAFAAADDETRAVVIAIHADMFEFAFAPRWNREIFLRHSGYIRFGEALIEEANAFHGPVLLVYGDSHRFQLHRPFPTRAPGILALETFGAAHMHAVEVTVTDDGGYPFAVRPLLNPWPERARTRPAPRPETDIGGRERAGGSAE